MSFIPLLARLEHGSRRVLEASAAFFAWLPLVFVLIQFSVVLLVYVFAAETTKARESLYYINALMIFGAVGYTLLADEHVRVDLFYSRMKKRTKAGVALFGSVFFLSPFLVFFWMQSFPIALQAWTRGQGSVEAGGLGFVYVLKAMPLLFVLALGLATLSLIANSILVLITGDTPSDSEVT